MAKKKTTARTKHRTIDAYQHARLRTEMYMGSRVSHTQEVLHFDGNSLTTREFTWVPALFTGMRELIDNALDEMNTSENGNTLRVTYDENTMECTVEDNSTGLPIHEIPSVGKGPAASLLLANMFSSSNFDDDERGSIAGLNGLGASVTNFTAEWFILDVWRGGKHFRQRWDEGTYRGADKHRTKGPTITKGAKGKTGTRVTYKPSAKVFSDMSLPADFVRGRLWDIAVANPRLRIFFNGTRLTPIRGRDPVEATYFSNMDVAKLTFRNGAFTSTFYLSPGFNGDDELLHSTVNSIPVLQGGSHVDAFRNMFYPAASAALTSPRGNPFTKEKLKLTRADIASGLLVFNVTKMDAPSFESQTKSRLITEVRTTMKDGIDNFEFEVGSVFRRNPGWVESIAERCRRRTSDRDAQEVNREQKKLARKRVAKLSDAIGKQREKCVLFLGEGDSALNLLMNVRNPEVHGCLPLRGKILNVHGVAPKKVIGSQALVDIMTSMGLTIGKKADPKTLRYGKLYIAADEDEDGKNITALLINFLYRFWPELFEKPFVYRFQTPLIIATKGKQRKYIYADEYDKFQSNPGKWKGWAIKRAKGLGSLQEIDWEHSLAKPTLVPIVDDGTLEAALDLIFNPTRADDRKEWLSHE